MAWLLATCPDPTFRDGPRAVEFAHRALENAAPASRAECLDTLAAALAEAGDFAGAVGRSDEAIALMEDANRRLKYEERLACYRQGLAYREDEIDWPRPDPDDD